MSVYNSMDSVLFTAGVRRKDDVETMETKWGAVALHLLWKIVAF